MEENKTNEVTTTVEQEELETNPVEPISEKKPFLSRFNSKQKLIGSLAILLIYTLIVVFITTVIQKQVIAHKIEKGFENVFSSTDDSGKSNNIADNIEETTGLENTQTKLSLNQTVTIGDVMELTLTSSEWVEEIKPSNTDGVYSYYEDKNGEKYFLIRGTAKNISGEDLDIQYANESELIINDTYKANVTIEAEENDGSSFYGDIKPLQTLNIIVYASVSDEVYNICEKVKVSMNILSDSEKIGYFYDEDYPHESFYIEFE